MVTRLLTLCMHCGRVLHKGPRDSDGGCSHGVCVKCLIERYSKFYTVVEIKEMLHEVAGWVVPDHS